MFWGGGGGGESYIRRPTLADELLLYGGELLPEAREVLVERPHEGLVGPEGGLPVRGVGGGGAVGAGGGAGWGGGLRRVTRDLVDEALESEDRLAVHGDVLQHRAKTVLQRERERTDC